jgi:hypothetical protein
MNYGVIKAGFREPRFIRKKVKDELDETPLLGANLRFSNKHFIAFEEAGARERYGHSNETHTDGRFLRRSPTELSLGPPAGTGKTSRGQEKQGDRPVPHPDANHAVSRHKL